MQANSEQGKPVKSKAPATLEEAIVRLEKRVTRLQRLQKKLERGSSEHPMAKLISRIAS
jgi:hypothetical protein